MNIEQTERIKRKLEIMLINEAPIGSIGILECIKNGTKLETDEIGLLYREALCLRDIYRTIDSTILTEETGKLIIERNKPLIGEYYDSWIKLWENYINSGFQSQEIPQRLFDIRKQIMKFSNDYEELPFFKLYSFAWKVDYFNQDIPKLSKKHLHITWHLLGKPTKRNPEKFPLVLQKAKEMGLMEQLK